MRYKAGANRYYYDYYINRRITLPSGFHFLLSASGQALVAARTLLSNISACIRCTSEMNLLHINIFITFQIFRCVTIKSIMEELNI